VARTPRPRGPERREALLDATLRVLVERGPEAVTHRRVAEAAGLPLASTTYWFASKDELVAEAYRLAARRDVERLEARAQALGPAGDPVAAILALVVDPFVGDTPEHRAEIVAAYTLWLHAARQPDLRAIAEGWIEAYVEPTAVLFARAGTQQPRRDARIVLAALDGLLLEQVASERPTPLRPALEHLVSVLAAP
jgi:DNA-binding transcriptional regulator YbjK